MGEYIPSEEIEVTPAMVSAGVAALVAWEASDDYAQNNLVARIFRAMEQARLQHGDSTSA